MPINADWHRAHVMPKNPTVAERVDWHLEHAKACACREIPPKLRAAIDAELARRAGDEAAPKKRAAKKKVGAEATAKKRTAAEKKAATKKPAAKKKAAVRKPAAKKRATKDTAATGSATAKRRTKAARARHPER